jgi:ADP-ribosylglycohydrolase
VLYLALKYANDPEKALVSNTNLGGDNVYRGAVLGALLGAQNGMEKFPRRWIQGLLNPPPEISGPVT